MTYRQCARNAQPLLLAAGEARPALVEGVLHFLPKCGCLEALEDRTVELVPFPLPVQPQPRRDVLVDRHGRERIRLLEDHPDTAAHADRRQSVDVLLIQDDLPFRPRLRDRLVHPVQAADQGRLPASRRTDDRGHGVLLEIHGDVLDRKFRSIPGRESFGADLRRHGAHPETERRRTMTREVMLITSMMRTRMRDAPHAAWFWAVEGLSAKT